MHKPKNQQLEIVEGMPVNLSAKLEFSNAMDLFRLAADHHTQYMALISNAWEDINDVVDWFVKEKKFDEGVRWLYDNTPDVFQRVLTINELLDHKKTNVQTIVH
jgi:hypothetical protein